MLRQVTLLFTLSLLGAVPALSADYTIIPGGKNQVVFLSTATLESFEGKTRQVSGSVSLDPANLADSIGVRIEVDLASLDTGISLRNKHMRENHLETDTYPKVVFEGARILKASSRSLEPGKVVHTRISGRFDLHGVKRTIEVPVDVTQAKDGSLNVTAKFDVPLADYNIDRPSFLLLKLNETQHITLTVTATPTK